MLRKRVAVCYCCFLFPQPMHSYMGLHRRRTFLHQFFRDLLPRSMGLVLITTLLVAARRITPWRVLRDIPTCKNFRFAKVLLITPRRDPT